MALGTNVFGLEGIHVFSATDGPVDTDYYSARLYCVLNMSVQNRLEFRVVTGFMVGSLINLLAILPANAQCSPDGWCFIGQNANGAKQYVKRLDSSGRFRRLLGTIYRSNGDVLSARQTADCLKWTIMTNEDNLWDPIVPNTFRELVIKFVCN